MARPDGVASGDVVALGAKIVAQLADVRSTDDTDHERPSSRFAAEFRRAEVSLASDGPCWCVTVFNYDRKVRSDVPDGPHRLRFSEGPTALAELLIELLSQ
jgi:hypothetical protein